MRRYTMTDGKSFKNWFENVFWYHYKWWFLAAVFVIALVVFIAVEAAGNEKYDMTVIFAQNGGITEEQANIVLDAISDSVGDLNGDGEIKLNYASVDLTAEDGSMNGQNVTMQDRLLLYMTDEECALFFLEQDISSVYISMGYFEDKLTDHGIEAPGDDPCRVYVSGTKAFSDAGLSGTEYYALIIDWTTVGKGSTERTDAAVNSIKTLLND